ncbi:hypothetical protein JCM9140_3142 [Halalkalibacter wakoensis JCM 9140]|uniref:Tape measure protein N-terminal domain-containing protein n=1 Tax=Halalkalibacter wakoensis JCM 9140 TaxID=1236970 RepID=W4Q508_9BACI|nr:tape measure protein [Halalkalibacter wakoensis]GAE27030.1 hypothetical protein JCM9140_3142 [Halalkalibacter wakoensis JCM 9140]
MSLLGNLTVGILGNMDGLTGTFKGAQSEIQKFGNSAQQLGRSISGVGDSLTRNITMPAVAAASALTGVALVKGFGRLVGIDTAQAKLKGLGHDAKSVEVIMSSALDSVRGTSYGMDEAATTAASAVAAGIDPGKELTRYLTLTGDAAAIAGDSMSGMGSIFNKVQTAQKAYNGELQMLSDRGLPIYQWLAEEAGVSAEKVRDLAAEGKVSSEMFLAAVEKNIGGAAKTMGEESFTAGIANIGAAISRVGANFLDAGGEAGGFFSTIKPLIGEAIGFIDGLADSAADLGVKFGEAFNNMIEKAQELKVRFDDLSPGMQDLVIKGAAIGGAILVGIGPALKIIGGLITSFGSLVKGIGLLFGPVGIAVASFAALVAAGVLIYKNWDLIKAKAEEVFTNFAPLFETVKGAFQDFWNSLGPIWSSLKNLFETLQPLLIALGVAIAGTVVVALGLLVSTFAAVVSAVVPVIDAVINFADMLINVFYAVISLLTGDFSGAWSYWQQASESAVNAMKSLWEGVVNFFSTFVRTILDFFTGLYMALVGNSIIPDMVREIVEWFQNMFQWLIDIVLKIVDAVSSGFKDMTDFIRLYLEMAKGIVDAVLSFFMRTFENATRFIVALVQGDFGEMKNIINDQMENASQLVSSILDNIKGFFDNLNLYDSGKAIIQSAIDGIMSMKRKITGVVEDIVGTVRDFWPFSPAKRGPLSDIHKMDFAGPISDSIDNARLPLEHAMDALAGNVFTKIDTDGISFGNNEGKIDGTTINFEGLFNGAIFNVRSQEDVEELARMLDEYMRRIARNEGWCINVNDG